MKLKYNSNVTKLKREQENDIVIKSSYLYTLKYHLENSKNKLETHRKLIGIFNVRFFFIWFQKKTSTLI